MKFIVKHEINGRLRIHVVQKRMTYTEADTLSWFLSNQKNVTDVKVYERTADAVICYVGDKEEVLNLLKQFSYENAILPEHVAAGSGRELNAVYQEKLVMKTVLHYGSKLFLPMPVRAVITSVKSVKYIWHGIRCLMHGKIEVPVLDATAISVSVFRRDYATAGSVMFLLGIGEIIEEWTHKKSVGDLPLHRLHQRTVRFHWKELSFGSQCPILSHGAGKQGRFAERNQEGTNGEF